MNRENQIPINNLIDLLSYRSKNSPDKTAYIYLNDGEGDADKINYLELYSQAIKIAGKIQSLNKKINRALLLYPSGLEFISAFFGCLFADVIAIPVYPPDPSKLSASTMRLSKIVKDANPDLILTTRKFYDLIVDILPESLNINNITTVLSDDIDSCLENCWCKPQINEDSIALIQYTSGSTGDPKGVVISHENILYNEAMIKEAFQLNSESKVIGWLPLYHDMGLMGNILQPLYSGCLCVFMSPLHFLEKPFRWLKAISDYKGTASGGPNFAYEYCANKITPSQISGLDLSTWEIAFCGSETVRYETIKKFVNTFGSCGFKENAFYPCYGMAEGTLLISGNLKGTIPITMNLDENSLQKNEIEVVAQGGNVIVSCGRTSLDQKIHIVNNDASVVCEENQIGEICINGPNVAQGYWNKPALTDEVFGAKLNGDGNERFLRTGDLGFLSNGELFVTGRIKDMIIVRGRNFYPQDIEKTIEETHDAIRPGCVAGFHMVVENEERLIVVCELREGEIDTEKVILSIRQAVSHHHDLDTYAILFTSPRSIPKTPSGKIQRRACQKIFLENRLPVIAKWISITSDKSRSEAQSSFLLNKLSAIHDDNARQSILALYLQERIARITNMPVSQIDLKQSIISQTGIDSLKAVELKSELENELGALEFNLTQLLTGITIEQLSVHFETQLSARNFSVKKPLKKSVDSEWDSFIQSVAEKNLHSDL